MAIHNTEATAQALSILRSGENFNHYVVFLLVAVLFIYFSEMKKGNWKGIAAGLTLYVIHWFVEIINGIVQFFLGHALWTVPAGTAYLVLIGLGIELNLMFAIAGLAVSKLLSEDPNEKMFGLPKKLVLGIGNAGLASVIEIFLIATQAFVWIWWWWNALTVFVFVYIPFFVGACYVYYWEPKKQKVFIGGLAIVDVVLLIIFAGILPAILGTVVI